MPRTGQNSLERSLTNPKCCCRQVIVMTGVMMVVTMCLANSLLLLQISAGYDRDGNGNGDGDYLDYTNSNTNTKNTHDDPKNAIEAYLQNMDLTIIPPKGSPPNLPSQPETDENIQEVSKIRARFKYGGKNDKAHLGGFTTVDPEGISPAVWRDMMEYFGVKSLLDVGCGRGFSTAWFGMQGVQVQCVEGSKDAIERNILLSMPMPTPRPMTIDKNVTVENENKNVPAEDDNDVDADVDADVDDDDNSDEEDDQDQDQSIIVEHDFSLGPWWPANTVDAVWCVELLEHVGRNFAPNYLTAFKKAGIIFASHSTWGGWHHVEVHDDAWWIAKFEMYGFVYSDTLTQRVRNKAREERGERIPFPTDPEKTYGANHVARTMMVFINPAVASRPEHSHLMSEPGCFVTHNLPKKHCGEDEGENGKPVINTRLPPKYHFLPYREDRHKAWEEYITVDVKEDRSKNE